MAIYHLSVKPISRGKGQSVVRKAAYNARTKLHDDGTGKSTKDYKHEGLLLFECILAPDGTPEWFFDREKLWNHVEAIESRKDARLAREIDVALPHELSDQERKDLVVQFVKEAFVSQGMIADVVVHAATKNGDERNCHAHILLATRRMGANGFDVLKNRDWDKVEALRHWREMWAELCNSYLEFAGNAARVSPLSYKALGIPQIPTKHVGPQISRMEAKGIKTRRGDYLRANKSNPDFLDE